MDAIAINSNGNKPQKITTQTVFYKFFTCHRGHTQGGIRREETSPGRPSAMVMVVVVAAGLVVEELW
jgi:hypothetical protein